MLVSQLICHIGRLDFAILDNHVLAILLPNEVDRRYHLRPMCHYSLQAAQFIKSTKFTTEISLYSLYVCVTSPVQAAFCQLVIK